MDARDERHWVALTIPTSSKRKRRWEVMIFFGRAHKVAPAYPEAGRYINQRSVITISPFRRGRFSELAKTSTTRERRMYTAPTDTSGKRQDNKLITDETWGDFFSLTSHTIEVTSTSVRSGPTPLELSTEQQQHHQGFIKERRDQIHRRQWWDRTGQETICYFFV